MKKAVIFDVPRTLSAYSLLFFQMPVLRFLLRPRPARRAPRLCGRSAAGAFPLCAGRTPAAGHPLFRRRHPQPSRPRRRCPPHRRRPAPAGGRDHTGSEPRDGDGGVPPGVPRRRRQPHLLRRPVGPGQPAQDAGPSPHRKAGPCGLCRRTPGRVREHQRRHHAGPAPLYAGRVRRDAGAYRGGRRDTHFGLPLKDRAGLCLWPDAPRGSAHLRRGGGLLPLRRRAAGAPRVSAVRDLELCPPRL